jgi:hypothetical protein
MRRDALMPGPIRRAESDDDRDLPALMLLADLERRGAFATAPFAVSPSSSSAEEDARAPAVPAGGEPRT